MQMTPGGENAFCPLTHFLGRTPSTTTTTVTTVGTMRRTGPQLLAPWPPTSEKTVAPIEDSKSLIRVSTGEQNLARQPEMTIQVGKKLQDKISARSWADRAGLEACIDYLVSKTSWWWPRLAGWPALWSSPPQHLPTPSDLHRTNRPTHYLIALLHPRTLSPRERRLAISRQ